jgi:hypothetical protein
VLTEPIGPGKVADYVQVFDEEIRWSQSRGLPGDWQGLRRRLDCVSVLHRDADARRLATSGRDWLYRFEYRCLVGALPDLLLPEVLDAVVAALRLSDGGAPGHWDVWAPLDRKSFRQRVASADRREVLAEASVVSALAQHARKPSWRRNLEGIRALHDLHQARAALDPVFDAPALISAGRQLVEALGEVLPPIARGLLSSAIELQFRWELEDQAVELGPARALWHKKLPDVGAWDPVWVQLADRISGPDPPGIWFREDLQEVYEECNQRAEGERVRDQAEEEEGREAALAREGAEEDPVADDARLRQEETARRRESEQRPQAAVREPQEWIEAEGQERERQRPAEVHQRGEPEEAERLEAKRRANAARPARPAQPTFRLGPHHGIRRRLAEEEFEKWCKRKGVDPGDFTDERREELLRHF